MIFMLNQLFSKLRNMEELESLRKRRVKLQGETKNIDTF